MHDHVISCDYTARETGDVRETMAQWMADGVGRDPPPSGELSALVDSGLACSVYVLKLAHRDITTSYSF